MIFSIFYVKLSISFNSYLEREIVERDDQVVGKRKRFRLTSILCTTGDTGCPLPSLEDNNSQESWLQ